MAKQLNINTPLFVLAGMYDALEMRGNIPQEGFAVAQVRCNIKAALWEVHLN